MTMNNFLLMVIAAGAAVFLWKKFGKVAPVATEKDLDRTVAREVRDLAENRGLKIANAADFQSSGVNVSVVFTGGSKTSRIEIYVQFADDDRGIKSIPLGMDEFPDSVRNKL